MVYTNDETVICYNDTKVAGTHNFDAEKSGTCNGYWCYKKSTTVQGIALEVRKCMTAVPDHTGCRRSGDVEVCFCRADACNGAEGLGSHADVIFGLLLTALMSLIIAQ
ncbi:hypothetical protein CAPTEDRAFT_213317 [Capitella teleta]|uniref:Protein sleepless n=1 Tax=Capitella teleta TaxID=283909 RepID=R7V1D0_CAPTE|nr:hypothetical protein CAPTEDRAFT_213317 [Capitella teleta]|eukprot:ELU12354.1 hypothetical protein CAPTEDRAFT_213317 [Capitella teleta]